MFTEQHKNEKYGENDTDYFSMHNANAINIATVVRCKNCKWFKYGRSRNHCDRLLGMLAPEEDGFCSRGEKRDE